MGKTFNIIALSNNNVRHMPCSATLTTDTAIDFDSRGKTIKATLNWDNSISPNQNKAFLEAKISACNNGRNLTFICGETEYITDKTNS